MAGRIWLGLAIVMFWALTGCQNEEYYRKQREEAAAKHFDEIKKVQAPAGKVFTLEECISYALKNNLDYRVYRLQEAVSNADKYSEILKMLPESNISLNLSQRNNDDASQSIDVKTGQQSLVMSRSSDRYDENFNVDIAFSAVDFGVAYLSSVQAQDRVLLNRSQERRAAQNLIFDVVKAYLSLAATQDAYDTTEQLLQKCRDIDKVFEQLSASRAISPLRIMDERKRFIRLEQAFMTFRRNNANAQIELKSLMGLAPDSELKIDTSILAQVDPSILALPDIYFLEKVALRERPELQQLDIQSHLTVIEGDKTIIKMFPNVKAYMDFTQDNNRFLYNHSWAEIGLRAAYNVARVPSQFVEYKALKSEQKELEIRSLALSFGVVGQVRVAYRNIDEVYRRFLLDDRFCKNYMQELAVARNNYNAGGDVKKIDLDRLELEAVENRIYRTVALSNCYLAYFRLLNSVGVEPRSINEAHQLFAQLKIKIARELPYCLGQHYVRDDGTIVYNGIDFETYFAEGQRNEVDELALTGFKKPVPPPAVPRPKLKVVTYGGATWVEQVWGGMEDSLSKVVVSAPKKDAARGFVRPDGVTVYNGVEVKAGLMSEEERGKLDKLAGMN